MCRDWNTGCMRTEAGLMTLHIYLAAQERVSVNCPSNPEHRTVSEMKLMSPKDGVIMPPSL